jgi:pimeloyl-ACP methyl ester carboxylesterase
MQELELASWPARLVLFPGLGADGRLFDVQRAGLPDVQIETPQWLEPEHDDETLEAYSRRMAQLIAPTQPGESLFLGGVSFGALVALEAARHLPGTRAVFMMGGCRDTRAVAPLFRFACWLAPRVPRPLFKLVLTVGPVGLVMFERLRGENLRLYTRMVRESSPRQDRWAAGALLKYRSTGDPPGVRVRLVHGQRDLIIPPKNVSPDYVIARGRHLVSLTCQTDVNRILRREMNVTS